MTWDAHERATNSKTFCILPWIQQYVGTLGDIKPCCVYDHNMEIGNLKNNSLKEIWNNDATKALRLKFLNGETDIGCKNCDLMSDIDPNRSSRANYNMRFFNKHHPYAIDAVKSTESDGSVPEHSLYYMDVRFNNLCNFKCRTCSPHFSTSWIIDYRKLWDIKNEYSLNNEFQYPGNYEDHALNEMLPHLPTLTQVYFAGGEPMIQKQHYETLQKLIEVGNTGCSIIYNTNFSKLRLQEHDVIEYWQHFKEITVLASIDGSHEKAEYWRHGTIWKDIVNNAKRVKQDAPHAKLVISYTLSWPNVFDMLDLHKEWVELGIINPGDLNINILIGPYYFSLSGLPLWKKQQIEKKYREHMEWIKSISSHTECSTLLGLFEHVIDYMYNGTIEKSVETTMHSFEVVTTKLDTIRNEDFFLVYPEHQDLKNWMISQGIMK